MNKLIVHYGGPDTLWIPIAFFIVVEIPLCLVRKLHKLAVTHLIADLFIAIGLVFYLALAIIKV